MKNSRLYYILMCLPIVLSFLTGCNESEEEAPEKVYDLIAFPGKNEAMIQFMVPSNADHGKIFYNLGDFDEFTVENSNEVQTHIVKGLSEGDNIIRVVTMNSDGLVSDPKGVSVYVYGDSYISNIQNRSFIGQDFLSNTSTRLTFGEASKDEKSMVIVYTNTSGARDSVIVSNAEESIEIDDIDLGKDYYYYSVFKPSDDFIGAYYTDKQSIPELTKKKLWKSIWKIIDFSSGDTEENTGKLIDDDINTNWTAPASDKETYITLDMQSTKLYDGFIVVQQQTMDGGYFSKKYRFESSNDGTTWEVVQEGRLKENGYKQKISFKNSVSSRYFRLSILDSYSSSQYPQIAEIDLYNDIEASGDNGLEFPVMANAKPPFQGDGSDRFPAIGAGRFQRVIGWTHNDNAYISYDGGSGTGQFCCFCAAVWGCSAVKNGKIYQNFELLPGRYSFNIQVGHTSNPACVDMFGIVSRDQEPADFDDVKTSQSTLGYADLVSQQYNLVPIEFFIDDKETVALGIVYNLNDVYASLGIIWSDMYIDSFELAAQ